MSDCLHQLLVAMRVSLIVTTVALLSRADGLGFEYGYSQENGREKLLSSSFGFPGTDQTFDYVVCLFHHRQLVRACPTNIANRL